MSARTVATANQPGVYADGGGLYLQVTCGVDGAPKRSWLLRFTATDGRRREMGLGSAAIVGLAVARGKAAELRKQIDAGVDPIDARRQARADAIAAARVHKMTFRQCATVFIDSHKSTWKNAKHQYQWTQTLETYACPVFGDKAIHDVNAQDIIDALEPIWLTKTETAVRLRARIEKVLDWAGSRGLRKGENPARWRGHLQHALPTIKKSARVRHHPALPFAEMPLFMMKLSKQQGASALALSFCILTATRTNETIGARWGEIDLDRQLWIIPAARMKVPREHRVPLSPAAIAVLRQAQSPKTPRPEDVVFAARPGSQPLSNMALAMTLRRMKRADITTHGFRSTFRDWVSERTGFAGEIAEAALAHTIGNQVEAAYRRGDLFDKRRKLMDAWGQYCVPDHTRARPLMSAIERN